MKIQCRIAESVRRRPAKQVPNRTFETSDEMIVKNERISTNGANEREICCRLSLESHRALRPGFDSIRGAANTCIGTLGQILYITRTRAET